MIGLLRPPIECPALAAARELPCKPSAKAAHEGSSYRVSKTPWKTELRENSHMCGLTPKFCAARGS